jgi:two-component system sensor histidine kinase/response regulator
VLAHWLPGSKLMTAERTPGSGRLDALRTVAGLDVATGLRLTMGKVSLYLALVEKLANSEADFDDRLRRSLAAGALDKAIRQAHTLKGSAGQIGAVNLYASAERLELALSESRPPEALQALLASVSEQLSSLLADIGAAMDLAEARPASIDESRVRLVCDRLAEALARDDDQCRQILEEHAALLRACLGDHYPWIVEAVRSFNFAAALDWLNEALAARSPS